MIKISIRHFLRNWWFPLVVAGVYLILALVQKDIFWKSITFGGKLLLKISPFFILIWFLMILSNSIIGKKLILKWLQQKKIYHWLLAVIGGILSSGPIYLWYPLLADLRKKGFNDGLIACFLYNRAIKLPLLPLLIYYFSWQYALILGLVMIGASLLQGLIINKIMK